MNKTLKIKAEVYSRCCGYFRPTMQWNAGKRAEFSDRIVFKIPDLAHNEVLAM